MNADIEGNFRLKRLNYIETGVCVCVLSYHHLPLHSLVRNTIMVPKADDTQVRGTPGRTMSYHCQPLITVEHRCDL